MTIFATWGELKGVTSNLSLGGMFIELAEPWPRSISSGPLDEEVTLTFEVPAQGESLEAVVEAVVRWVRDETGVGVEFLGLRRAEQAALTRWFGRVSAAPVAAMDSLAGG